MKFKEMYFHSVAIAAGVGLMLGFSGIANAESYYQMGKVESVTPYYKEVTTRTPSQVCTEVEVPVYGQTKRDNTGDILGGAIIGGIIGNNIGSGSGNGAAGAVIGGLLGNSHGNAKSETIVGYRKENRCSTTYTSSVNQVFAGNKVVVSYNGMNMSFTTNRQVQPGDEYPIRVTISAR